MAFRRGEHINIMAIRISVWIAHSRKRLLADRKVPPGLIDVLVRCVSADAKRRPANAGVLAETLKAVQDSIQ